MPRERSSIMNDASVSKETILEGKDPRMTVISESPLVLETPVRLLAGERITDKQHLFVRNIQDLDSGLTMKPVLIDGGEIELSGLIIPFRVIIRRDDMLNMEKVEHERVRQCTGNGEAQSPGSTG